MVCNSFSDIAYFSGSWQFRGPVICRIILHLYWPEIFLMVSLRLWVLGKNPREEKCPSYHETSKVLLSTWHPVGIPLDDLGDGVFAKFFHYKVSLCISLSYSLLRSKLLSIEHTGVENAQWGRELTHLIHIRYLEFSCKDLSLLL